MTPAQRAETSLGRRGEDLAAAWLTANGFRIRARNLRTRVGEIDILADHERLLVAVEVKTRTRHAAPELPREWPALERKLILVQAPMPPGRIHSERSLLQRRKSLTTTLQAMVDGLIVLFTVYYALYNAQGFISTIDAVFMITLLAIMGVTYDQMGVYRQFGGYLKSARKLFFAWSASFAITLFIFIMAQYFEQLSQPDSEERMIVNKQYAHLFHLHVWIWGNISFRRACLHRPRSRCAVHRPCGRRAPA